MRRLFALLSAAALLAGLVAVVSPAPVAAAGIVFDGSPGTNPPPATLGSYPMTPFPHDDRFGVVTSVPAPGAGSVGFSEYMGINDVLPWQPWPVGYTGRVYATFSNSLVLTLPAATRAFYFYARSYDYYEPGDLGTLTVTAIAQDGTSGVAIMGRADDCAPHYFGFYATGGTPVTSITIESTSFRSWMNGIDVGEFGIYRSTGASPWTPDIFSFSPGSGRVGSLVTIMGRNFGYATAVRFNGVAFNGVAATFSVRGPSIIVATVPVGAKTGPIRVRSPFGTASSMRSFYVLLR